MQPETPAGETQVVTEPKTNANPTPVAQPTAVDTEVEKLRKELAQATMRGNQLENQLNAKTDAEKAAEAAKLEEQNEYKTLYEQTQAKLRETEAAQEKATKDAEIKTATDKLFADYPEQVKAIAQETGLALADTDEASVELFKAKLDKLTPMVSSGKVTPNNPGTVTPVIEVSNQDLAEIMRDPAKFQEYLLKNSKGIASQIRPKPE